MSAIVIATPHARYDALEAAVRQQLGGVNVIRLRAREELTVDRLRAIAPSYVFFPHWSWKIPDAIHGEFECVMFHMTDLPYGRGGSPLQNLIVREHTDTVLTALRCSSRIDAGPVYRKVPLSLAGTAEEILSRASVAMVPMIVDIATNRPVASPQEGSVVEFARRRPADGDIAALKELERVYDYIRMLDADGYPHAFLETEHLRLEFTHARLADGSLEASVTFHPRSE